VARKQTKSAGAEDATPLLRPRRAPKPSSLVYVYCIVQSATVPPLRRVKGLPDADAPRAVSLEKSRWLVLADVPRSRFNETALDAGLHDLDWVGACALAHDALIMDVMRSGPVVPMRLFTIFEDERRARSQARRAARQISSTLRRVAGHAEYGVRIGTRPGGPPGSGQARSAASAGARSTGSALAPAGSGRPRELSGRSFLEHKRDQLVARRRPTVSSSERRRVFERLAAIADDARERPIPESGTSVWLDGAFLVAIGEAAAFRREVERLARELRSEGHDVVLTGPWPPYNFLDEHAVQS
jgi:hypothetical protein